MSSMECRPFLSDDPQFAPAAISTIPIWLDQICTETETLAPELKAQMTQFIIYLKELPWPIVYITLHYLINNSLNFNQKESNGEYYEWIISIFEIIRFFCCLATIDKVRYEGKCLVYVNLYYIYIFI
jgi:hypothetical protein